MADGIQEREQIRRNGAKALRRLQRLVKAAGGADEVARRIGSTRSHVANVIFAIRPLGKETAARLRGVLAINDRAVLDLMAMDRSDLEWLRSRQSDRPEASA